MSFALARRNGTNFRPIGEAGANRPSWRRTTRVWSQSVAVVAPLGGEITVAAGVVVL